MASPKLDPDDLAYERDLLLDLAESWMGEHGDGMAPHTRSRVELVGRWLLHHAAAHGFGRVEVEVGPLSGLLGCAPTGVKRGLRYLDLMGVIRLADEPQPGVWVLDHAPLARVGLEPRQPFPYILTRGTSPTSLLVLGPEPDDVMGGVRGVVLVSLPGGGRRMRAVVGHGLAERRLELTLHYAQPGHVRNPIPVRERTRSGTWIGGLGDAEDWRQWAEGVREAAIHHHEERSAARAVPRGGPWARTGLGQPLLPDDRPDAG